MAVQQPVLSVALATAGVLALAHAAPASAKLVRESQLVDELGTCLVRGEPAKTKALLETQADSPAERATLKELGLRATNCMKVTRLRIPSWVFRGTIAGTMLRSNPAWAEEARALPRIEPVRVKSGERTGLLMRSVFACAVRAEPTAAVDLVVADLETPALSDAVARFAPGMQACVPEDAGFKTTKVDIRVDAARALYERLAATGATSVRN